MGLSLNIEMSSTAFIEPLPVIDFVTQLLNRDMSRPLSDSDRVKVFFSYKFYRQFLAFLKSGIEILLAVLYTFW